MNRPFFIYLIGVLLSGCVSTIDNFSPESEMIPDSEGEVRIWYQAEKIDESISDSGQLVEHELATVYMQQVMEGLFPEYHEYIKVHILSEPVLNAFALPNGSIYMNSGMLAVMENEAQLATVLAHEAIHFLNKHSAKGREHQIQAAGWSIVTASLGIPLLSEILFYSTVTGHSREHETEADIEGYRRLEQAGYDLFEASKPFEAMLAYINAEDIDLPYFFSTHPRLEKRIKNFKSLNQSRVGGKGKKNAGQFMRALNDVRINALRRQLQHGHYKSLVVLLEKESLRESYGEEALFILAESYRLRNQQGDREKSIAVFDSMTNRELLVEANYSLGLIWLKEGDMQLAADHFKNYLEKGIDNEKRQFSKYYLNTISKKQMEN